MFSCNFLVRTSNFPELLQTTFICTIFHLKKNLEKAIKAAVKKAQREQKTSNLSSQISILNARKKSVQYRIWKRRSELAPCPEDTTPSLTERGWSRSLSCWGFSFPPSPALLDLQRGSGSSTFKQHLHQH